MEETQELLREVIGRLNEMSGEVKALRQSQAQLSAEIQELQPQPEETDTRLAVIEAILWRLDDKVDHLTAKWIDTDRQIFLLKRRLYSEDRSS